MYNLKIFWKKELKNCVSFYVFIDGEEWGVIKRGNTFEVTLLGQSAELLFIPKAPRLFGWRALKLNVKLCSDTPEIHLGVLAPVVIESQLHCIQLIGVEVTSAEYVKKYKRLLKQFRSESSNNTEESLLHKDAVSYKHIHAFGDEFLFAPKAMQVSKYDVEFFESGLRHDTEERCHDCRIVIFESKKYKKIVRLSFSIPTFDSGDREYDSWRALFLLQEHNGIIRAVYCAGGYRVAHVEGYAQVYQYPEILKKYFRM